MKNHRTISAAWVSEEARDKWSGIFHDLGRAFISSTLSGVHHGRWEKRDMKLYGNSWLLFLSMAKSYNVSYVSRIAHDQSSASRICREVQITCMPLHGQHTPEAESSPSMQPTIWDVAVGSPGSLQKAPGLIEHHSTPVTIHLWQDFGLSLFAHAPSSLSCINCAILVKDHFEWMRSIKLEKEAEIAEEILSWPVEWSSLNGIEELRTPIVKLMSTNWLHPYHEKRIVQVHGTKYPQEGAFGLQFPYRKKHFRAVSDSASFKKGILHNTSNL
jgi:hypothetical protein